MRQTHTCTYMNIRKAKICAAYANPFELNRPQNSQVLIMCEREDVLVCVCGGVGGLCVGMFCSHIITRRNIDAPQGARRAGKKPYIRAPTDEGENGCRNGFSSRGLDVFFVGRVFVGVCACIGRMCCVGFCVWLCRPNYCDRYVHCQTVHYTRTLAFGV